MRGTLSVNRGIMTTGTPEMRELIRKFIELGKIIKSDATPTDNTSKRIILWVDAFTEKLASFDVVIDHPDFDVEDGRYVLVIKDFRDPATFYNRGYKLTKLQRIDDTGEFITVKEYA